MNSKLYIEYRVYFKADTNQELLHKLAEEARQEIWDMHDGLLDENSGPLPEPLNVTYEVCVDALLKE